MKNLLGECNQPLLSPFLGSLPDVAGSPLTQTTSRHQKEQDILSPQLCKVKSTGSISVPFSHQRPARPPHQHSAGWASKLRELRSRSPHRLGRLLCGFS